MITLKKVFFTISNVIICFFAYAQISTGEIPASFFLSQDHTIIPTITTPRLDFEKIKKEDLATNTKASGYRFGIDFYQSISMTEQGIWTSMPDGSRICRLRLRCPGAVSVSFTFDQYKLPDGGKLFVYTPDRQQVLGAFTSKNNQKDGYFSVSLLMDEEVILEYQQPNTDSEKAQLRLWRITHGYRGPGVLTKGFGDAGYCHINVRCDEGKGWEKPINATCAIIDGGKELCTGTLINNARQDGTPYLLTANHCFSLAPNTGTWVFWFNWESPTCENVTKSPPKNTLSGAQSIAYNSNTDFFLLKLNTAPPLSYNPVYSGWSRLTTPPDSAACIHHPQLDVKKISPTNSISISSFYQDENNMNAWKAEWSSACTETGSSGSALFDQQRRIIGQLWGGASYCGAPAEEMYDYYGRLDLSWNSDMKTTRLRDWLDPDSTNIMTLDSYTPATGIRQTKLTEPHVNIFPNPAHHSVSIELSDPSCSIEYVHLFDMTGKLLVKQNSVKNYRTTLNVDVLPKGLYFIKIGTPNGVTTNKLLVD